MGNRREFLALAACVAALPSFAATPSAPRRIGWLTAQQVASLAPYLDALSQGLAEYDLVPGQTLEILARYGDDDISRVPALARDLVGSGVELLIVQGAAVSEALRLQLPVPMVFVTSADPVAAGFAKSLAQPSGNCTGVTFMAFELLGKRLELLKEIVPRLNSVTVLGNPLHPGSDTERAASEEAGHRLGIEVDYISMPNSDAITAARATLGRTRPDAISLLADGFAIAHRKAIMAMTNDLGIPVISGWPAFAEAGALCTYGPHLPAVYRRVAFFVTRILAGAKPGELPVERPTQFELVLNQSAARSFHLQFSRAILARADKVIE